MCLCLFYLMVCLWSWRPQRSVLDISTDLCGLISSFCVRQPAGDVSNKPCSRLPLLFCQAYDYLPNFKASLTLAGISLYYLVSRGMCTHVSLAYWCFVLGDNVPTLWALCYIYIHMFTTMDDCTRGRSRRYFILGAIPTRPNVSACRAKKEEKRKETTPISNNNCSSKCWFHCM